MREEETEAGGVNSEKGPFEFFLAGGFHQAAAAAAAAKTNKQTTKKHTPLMAWCFPIPLFHSQPK